MKDIVDWYNLLRLWGLFCNLIFECRKCKWTKNSHSLETMQCTVKVRTGTHKCAIHTLNHSRASHKHFFENASPFRWDYLWQLHTANQILSVFARTQRECCAQFRRVFMFKLVFAKCASDLRIKNHVGFLFVIRHAGGAYIHAYMHTYLYNMYVCRFVHKYVCMYVGSSTEIVTISTEYVGKNVFHGFIKYHLTLHFI